LLGCALGLMAIFGQGMEGMDKSMSASWAGVAVLLKNPTAYMAAFACGLGRDLGDPIAHVGKPEPGIGVLVIVVFLIADVLSILAANKARKLSL